MDGGVGSQKCLEVYRAEFGGIVYIIPRVVVYPGDDPVRIDVDCLSSKFTKASYRSEETQSSASSVSSASSHEAAHITECPEFEHDMTKHEKAVKKNATRRQHQKEKKRLGRRAVAEAATLKHVANLHDFVTSSYVQMAGKVYL